LVASVLGFGPPLLMYAPDGFNAVVETWSTQSVYARIKLLDHLPRHFTCIAFDRRDCGQSGGRLERALWKNACHAPSIGTCRLSDRAKPQPTRASLNF
jgi:pimeloyl-ACP methyl ester carboxylesterase